MSVTISGSGVITGVDAGTFDVPVVDDTGSPWEIPFADGGAVGSLAALSEDVADAVAAGLSAAGNAGIGSNVVQTVKNNAFSTTSTSYTDVTGLQATITPSSDSSKILVIADVMWSNSAQNNSQTYFTIADGSNNNLIVSGGGATLDSLNGEFLVVLNNTYQRVHGALLHSPGTSSPFSYKIRMRVNANTGYVNRAGSGTTALSVSTLTLIEVAV